MNALLEKLQALRALGATRVAFHPDGEVSAVDFGPLSADPEHQHDDPNPGTAPMRSVTGGLVPRAERHSQ